MQIVYAKETLPQTSPLGIFLAGPTPRRKDVQSWRPDALRILEYQGYEGTVYVPEARDGTWKPDEYEMQVEWEEAALNKAACILFWVPRKMDTLPGLVTNVEFGVWQGSGKVVFGAPVDAAACRYLRYYATPHPHCLDAQRDVLLGHREGARLHGSPPNFVLSPWQPRGGSFDHSKPSEPIREIKTRFKPSRRCGRPLH